MKTKMGIIIMMVVVLTSCINQKYGHFYPPNVVIQNSDYVIGERYFGIAEQSLILGLNTNSSGLYYTAYHNLKKNASLKPSEAFTNITIDQENQMIFFHLFTIKRVIIGADIIRFTEKEEE
jgi:hypothetical protein